MPGHSAETDAENIYGLTLFDIPPVKGKLRGGTVFFRAHAANTGLCSSSGGTLISDGIADAFTVAEVVTWSRWSIRRFVIIIIIIKKKKDGITCVRRQSAFADLGNEPRRPRRRFSSSKPSPVPRFLKSSMCAAKHVTPVRSRLEHCFRFRCSLSCSVIHAPLPSSPLWLQDRYISSISRAAPSRHLSISALGESGTPITG